MQEEIEDPPHEDLIYLNAQHLSTRCKLGAEKINKFSKDELTDKIMLTTESKIKRSILLTKFYMSTSVELFTDVEKLMKQESKNILLNIDVLRRIIDNENLLSIQKKLSMIETIKRSSKNKYENLDLESSDDESEIHLLPEIRLSKDDQKNHLEFN